MGKHIGSSSSPKALASSFPVPPLADAMDAVRLSVDRFCLLAGVEALAEMLEEDATTVCGARHRRHGDRRGYRWGHTHSEIGYHGGKVKVARPRVRDHAGKEVSLESRQVLRDGTSSYGHGFASGGERLHLLHVRRQQHDAGQSLLRAAAWRPNISPSVLAEDSEPTSTSAITLPIAS
jgi:hypothetical protein